MIFSSQLGKLDGSNTEQLIQSVANHLRKMQQELEYRLSVLDSSNINEINADETKFLVNGEEINNIITKQDGRMTQFEQTVDGFRKTVADYEKGYSEWTQTVEGFTQQVGNYESKVSEWSQTVDGFRNTVADYTLGYASWEQTVSGFRQQVADYQNALSTTLKMDASGLYITDQSGNTVRISGEQIDASTIRVSNLYGGKIYLKYPVYVPSGNLLGYVDAGQITVSDASTAAYAFDLTSYGALRLAAQSGDAYISAGGYVTLDGADGNTSRGNFTPSGSDMYTLGASNYRWADIYAMNSEITTSDREKKNSIDYDMKRYEKFFDLLRPCSYKLNDGTSDRTHVNMISQDVEEALNAAGLTSKDFAGFIKSPKLDEDGNVIEGEYEYALRYGEFIGLCIAEIQKLKGRVEELEKQ